MPRKILINDKVGFVLAEGDAIYFDSAVRHSYRRVGKNCAAR